MVATCQQISAYLYSQNITTSWRRLDSFLELYRICRSGNRRQSHILGGQTGTSDLTKCNHTTCLITNLAVKMAHGKKIIQMLHDSPWVQDKIFWVLKGHPHTYSLKLSTSHPSKRVTNSDPARQKQAYWNISNLKVFLLNAKCLWPSWLSTLKQALKTW